jgi:hypothetical protein
VLGFVMAAGSGNKLKWIAEAKPWHPVKNTIADNGNKPSYWQAIMRSAFGA